MDESATGSVNFWSDMDAAPVRARPLGSAAMHLRVPSIDQGVQSFVWALTFFLYVWLGSLAVGFPGGTSLVIALLVGAASFLFVRIRGAGAAAGS